jgi:hypothetical protein
LKTAEKRLAARRKSTLRRNRRMRSGASVGFAEKKTVSAQAPDQNRNRAPHYECREKSDCAVRHGHQFPCSKRETDEADASDRCPARIQGSSLSPATGICYSRFSFLLPLVLLEQSSTRRKERRESEEQTAEYGSVTIRQHSCNGRDCTSKEEAHGQLVPSRILQGRNVEMKSHSQSAQQHVPNSHRANHPHRDG